MTVNTLHSVFITTKGLSASHLLYENLSQFLSSSLLVKCVVNSGLYKFVFLINPKCILKCCGFSNFHSYFIEIKNLK